jgi:tetratricopeptide (TPR) repeat protein
MRQKRLQILTLGGVMVLLAAGYAAAQGTPPPRTPTPAPTATPVPPAAPKAADQALRSLFGWQAATTRQTLEAKQASEGSTAAFKAAWGYLLAQEGKFDEAFASLNAAIAADPKEPVAELLKGEALYAQRKKATDESRAAWQKAVDKARAAVAASPDDARARFLLGTALVRTLKAAEGREALNAALARGFDPVLVGYQVGLSHVVDKSWQNAKEQYDAVLASAPNFAYAYFYRALAWRELRKTPEMTVDLNSFLRLAPNAPDAGIAGSLLRGAGGG